MTKHVEFCVTKTAERAKGLTPAGCQQMYSLSKGRAKEWQKEGGSLAMMTMESLALHT